MAYLRKVKKGWQVNINYIDPATGKRRRKTKVVRGTKKEAQVVMAEMIQKFENGSLLDPEETTLEQYLKNWLKDKESNVAYRTYKEYYNIVHTHIIPALGKIPIKEIKKYHIRDYFNEKRENGRIDGSGGLSSQTLKHHYIILNNALKQAEDDDLIHKNPCKGYKPPKVVRKREMNIMTIKQVKELLEILKDTWLYPVVFLEVNTGMRRGELAALQWQDINFKNKLIHVQRSAYRKIKQGIKYKKPKTKSSNRSIDIGDNVIAMLKEHRKKQLEITKFSEGYNPYNLVFPLENGDQLDPNIITHRFSKALKNTEFEVYRFHDLRHTHVSLLLEAGIPIKVIQERLGHASIKTTMDIYAHLIPGMGKQAAERLEERLKITSQ